VEAAHDCSKGGLAIALAEMSIKGGLGVKVDLEKIPASKGCRIDELLFSESYARVILEVPARYVKNVLRLAEKHGSPASKIGEVSPREDFTLQFKGSRVISQSLTVLREAWMNLIAEAMEGGGSGKA